METRKTKYIYLVNFLLCFVLDFIEQQAHPIKLIICGNISIFVCDTWSVHLLSN